MLTAGRGWTLLILSWLIPGVGFLAVRRYARGLAILFLIETPFVIGAALKGVVLPPVWTAGDWGANIVNVLTFVTQMGNGLGGLLCLAGYAAQTSLFESFRQLPLFELASFYVMVSGGLNYFCVCNFHDRLMKPHAIEGA